MINVEHEPRQLIVGAVLMVATAIIQTFAVMRASYPDVRLGAEAAHADVSAAVARTGNHRGRISPASCCATRIARSSM